MAAPAGTGEDDWIRIRRVDPHGEEAASCRKDLHNLVDPLYTGKPRVRSSLPDTAVVLVAEVRSSDEVKSEFQRAGSVAIKPLEQGEHLLQGLSQGTAYAEVKRMVVLPAYQGTGVAQRLLASVEKIAVEEMQAKCIVLETLLILKPARRFYEKSGYKLRSVYGHYDGADSQCYEKWVYA